MQLEDIPPRLRESIDDACNQTRYSLAEARRAVSDLRFDDLERAELPAALPEIAKRMIGRTLLQTSVHVVGTPRRLSPVTEKSLVRIFQEAMANAVKHAHARVIDIELRYDQQGLALGNALSLPPRISINLFPAATQSLPCVSWANDLTAPSRLPSNSV